MPELPHVLLYLRALAPRVVGQTIEDVRPSLLRSLEPPLMACVGRGRGRATPRRNEANDCAGCQTDGRLLAERSLSRLLEDDWPQTLEELERGRL